LYKQNVVSERKYIESKTAYTTDSIKYYNLASKVTEKGMEVVSPITGYIHELNFSEGQYVELGQQIVTISNNKYLLLRADVPMQHYSLVGNLLTANFRTAYSDKIYNIDELQGKLLAKGSSVAENDHYIPVYFELTNDGSLLEGAFVDVFLKTGKKDSVLLVPENAVTEEQGVHYVYVQVSGESYSKRAVIFGDSDGYNLQILKGLTVGERVVCEGIMLLKAASLIRGETAHGHNH
jgi:RND family efflux transporter MFP subunit